MNRITTNWRKATSNSLAVYQNFSSNCMQNVEEKIPLEEILPFYRFVGVSFYTFRMNQSLFLQEYRSL